MTSRASQALSLARIYTNTRDGSPFEKAEAERDLCTWASTAERMLLVAEAFLALKDGKEANAWAQKAASRIPDREFALMDRLDALRVRVRALSRKQTP